MPVYSIPRWLNELGVNQLSDTLKPLPCFPVVSPSFLGSISLLRGNPAYFVVYHEVSVKISVTGAHAVVVSGGGIVM